MLPALFKFQKVLKFRCFNDDNVFLEDDWNIYFMVK
ncbi:hypothetical protein K4I02_0658 [Streptococcus gordonii]|mgnify:FL=1|nr:hypothetical protein [Streptococcus gordonii]RSJ53733.1 hypothetical protein D8814_01345 [Streptococcus gordonii]RSJ63318.1 hypothetical protein D8810_04350 [Streptococcus gordonii]